MKDEVSIIVYVMTSLEDNARQCPFTIDGYRDVSNCTRNDKRGDGQ